MVVVIVSVSFSLLHLLSAATGALVEALLLLGAVAVAFMARWNVLASFVPASLGSTPLLFVVGRAKMDGGCVCAVCAVCGTIFQSHKQ